MILPTSAPMLRVIFRSIEGRDSIRQTPTGVRASGNVIRGKSPQSAEEAKLKVSLRSLLFWSKNWTRNSSHPPTHSLGGTSYQTDT